MKPRNFNVPIRFVSVVYFTVIMITIVETTVMNQNLVVSIIPMCISATKLIVKKKDQVF